MYLILGACILSVAAAAKLHSGYHPPSGSENAGGFPGDISAPLHGANHEHNIIEIIDQQFESLPDGSYSYKYQTANGINAEETGEQKEAPEGPGTASKGSYSYPGPDGTLITVTYTADENGFVAEGAHLPTPPPIPAEIYRSLLISDESRIQSRVPFRQVQVQGSPVNYRFAQRRASPNAK